MAGLTKGLATAARPAQAVGRRRLAVVGAGWAGLAAAVEATWRGHVVTVLETARTPGGRARTVQVGGEALDNGQHILIGAYRDTLRLMDRVGVEVERVLHRMPLTLVDPAGKGLVLPRGPGPIALARAVLALDDWPLADRLALLARSARWALGRFRAPPGQTVSQLSQGLPDAVLRELVEPLCVAALNTPARAASAQVFLRVLRDAMLAGSGSSDLLLPRVPMGSLFPEAACDWLMRHGATVRMGHRAQSLRPVPAETGSGGCRWELDAETFDGVVLACPAREASRLTVEVSPRWSATAASLPSEPITTVTLESPGSRLARPMVRLPGEPAQFAFDHGVLWDRPGRFTFVVSAAGHWAQAGTEATVAAVIEQAAHALSGRGPGDPIRVVACLSERRATFRCEAGLERPPMEVAPGLVAAGDFVRGPYPATLEGAVRSGLSAARHFR